jgi:glycosyltransferase involved in cell wall biosynthesis
MIPRADAKRRLAVVLSHPTQYYSPWFRWIRAHSQIDFRVFYLWDFGVTERHDPKFRASFKWDVDLLSGYEHEFVPNVSKRPGTEHFLGLSNPGLAGRLAAWAPTELMLFGYKSASHLRAIFWALRNRVPILFRGDSHLLGRGYPKLHVRLALRVLYSRFSSFLYVGAANRDYFKALGVPDEKLFFAPHSVDSTLFDRDSPSHNKAALKLRQELGISPSTRVVLFAGKFIADKQPMELLAAFARLKQKDATLVFVGEGPQRDALKAFALEGAPAAESPSVKFLPFANQSEMPSRYLLADVFVLPSRGNYETWGLAVNEAMHMGVPCLVSDRVGCQQDLVTQGETGWVFDSTDPRALEQSLSQALSELGSKGRSAEIRRAVELRIAGYTYARTTTGLAAALAAAGD